MPSKRLTLIVAAIVLFTSLFMTTHSAKAASVIITQTANTCTTFAIWVDNSDVLTHNVQFIAGGVTSANPFIAGGVTVGISVTFSYPGGSVINYDIYMDGNLVSASSYTCPGVTTTSDIPGPSVPAGFVLRTITCTTAVFNVPGGSPVGDNKIVSGQTWFVSPTTSKAQDGSSWTEVFDAGYIDGYLPTACVGGKPAGYQGS
jgi:hypothetical protein